MYFYTFIISFHNEIIGTRHWLGADVVTNQTRSSRWNCFDYLRQDLFHVDSMCANSWLTRVLNLKFAIDMMVRANWHKHSWIWSLEHEQYAKWLCATRSNFHVHIFKAVVTTWVLIVKPGNQLERWPLGCAEHLNERRLTSPCYLHCCGGNSRCSSIQLKIPEMFQNASINYGMLSTSATQDVRTLKARSDVCGVIRILSSISAAKPSSASSAVRSALGPGATTIGEGAAGTAAAFGTLVAEAVSIAPPRQLVSLEYWKHELLSSTLYHTCVCAQLVLSRK